MDTVGAVCSTLCAAHCASVALAPSLLVALGLGAMIGPTMEWGFTLLAILIGIASVTLGWRSQRARWTLMILAAGVVGLAAGRLLEVAGWAGFGASISIASGLALAAGHLLSIRVRRA